jgi:Protein of unknown function (DUF3592)
MYAVLAILALTGFYALVRHWLKTRQLRTSEDWPIAEGYVAQVEEKGDENGFLVVTLAFTYKVADERYVGRESFPFVRDEDAARYESGCKERSVQVHYRPDKPGVSALARQNMPSQLS